MPRHLEPQQLSPAMAQDQKRKQEIKGQRRNDAHIDGGDRLSVISQKCLPGLRRRLPTIAPCISRPSTGRLRTRASEARHGSGMRPTAGFPCSSAGSDHAGHDRSSAALPYFGISSARTTLNPARCHRRMVSGCTTWATPRRLGQSRVIHMSNARSLPRSRRRGGARRKAMLS